jgi:hypothetical protein
MIPFPPARLKEIELEVINDCYAKIKESEDKRRLYWTFGCFFGWLAIDLVMLSILKPTTGDSDMNILFGSLVLGSIAAAPIGYTIAKYINKKKFLAMSKDFLDHKKELMVQKILDEYHINNDIDFFKQAYVFGIMDYTKRSTIDKFLQSQNKTLDEYLSLLSKKELAILTEPYKQQLTLEAKARVDEFFIKKDEQSVQNMEFYEKGKEFFYSGLPKNLANV